MPRIGPEVAAQGRELGAPGRVVASPFFRRDGVDVDPAKSVALEEPDHSLRRRAREYVATTAAGGGLERELHQVSTDSLAEKTRQCVE